MMRLLSFAPDAALTRLASLSAVSRTQMEIGGRTFDVVTSPIIGASGHLGVLRTLTWP